MGLGWKVVKMTLFSLSEDRANTVLKMNGLEGFVFFGIIPSLVQFFGYFGFRNCSNEGINPQTHKLSMKIAVMKELAQKTHKPNISKMFGKIAVMKIA